MSRSPLQRTTIIPKSPQLPPSLITAERQSKHRRSMEGPLPSTPLPKSMSHCLPLLTSPTLAEPQLKYLSRRERPLLPAPLPLQPPKRRPFSILSKLTEHQRPPQRLKLSLYQRWDRQLNGTSQVMPKPKPAV